MKSLFLYSILFVFCGCSIETLDHQENNNTKAFKSLQFYFGHREISDIHQGEIFRNINFVDGITIYNTNNVIFENCTFQNEKGFGVLFRRDRNSDNTNNIEFINCKFKNSKWDNVMINRDDDTGNERIHENTIFKGCSFEGWGSVEKESERRYYHAIYAKSPDVIIDSCFFNQTITKSGHAVSLRSSGEVKNSIFTWLASGTPAITYSPKPLKGTPNMGSDSILIENNLIYSNKVSVTNGLIHLETQSNQDINVENIVSSIKIRFNTVVLLPEGDSENRYISALRVNRRISPSDIRVIGNLFVDGRNNSNSNSIVENLDYIDLFEDNILSTDLDSNFQNWRDDDYNLKFGSEAINNISLKNATVPFDIKKRLRNKESSDAGCYEYNN